MTKNLTEFIRRFNLRKRDIKEAIKQHHFHMESFGGSSWIIHFDKERNEIDAYKLVECCSLDGDLESKGME